MDTDLTDAVGRFFRMSDIGGAVNLLEKRLAEAENLGRFRALIGGKFTNSPQKVLSSVNDFVVACKEEFAIEAVYLEMNGFDINPDRWYFDYFGYADYNDDPDDLEWLCDWESPPWPQLTLTGLEAVQADFEWYHSNEMWNDKRAEAAYDPALLLVMCKYVSLIEASLASGRLSKQVPVLATAHDFDILGRFEP